MELLDPAPLPTDAAETGIEVSVVVLCLDEARTGGRCVQKALRALQQLSVRGEVLVADNGSSDDSPEVAQASDARVIHIARRGYGCALQAGIAAARGRDIIMGDADDSYDFGQLAPFLERLRQGDDSVMGNLYRGGNRPGAMPWLYCYIGNPFLTRLLNLFFRDPVDDSQSVKTAGRKQAASARRSLGLANSLGGVCGRHPGGKLP